MVLVEPSDERCEQIAERNGEQPQAHDRALQRRGCMAKCELQAGGRDEHFGESEQRILAGLPQDAEFFPAFDAVFEPRGCAECDRENGHACAHAREERRLQIAAFEPRVDAVGKKRDEQQNEQRVERLHRFAIEGVVPKKERQDAGREFSALLRPRGVLLIVEGPKNDDRREDSGDSPKDAAVLGTRVVVERREFAGGRHFYKGARAEPEDERGNSHRDAGNPKRPTVSTFRKYLTNN